MADNSNADLVVAFSTSGSPEQARRIATALVAEQLAACVNIVDNIHSIYRWQGAIESAAESLMLIKTRATLLPAIELRLRAPLLRCAGTRRHPDRFCMGQATGRRVSIMSKVSLHG
jgi:periplasmic divalent cation tolerance protein